MNENDPIEKAIGRFGKYQTWMLILMILGRLPTEFQLTNVVFLLPNVEYTCLDYPSVNVTNTCPCGNPQYDQSVMLNSVTSTWNLICERRSLASLAQSMLQVGILMGSLFYGHIADRYGRKMAIVLTLFFESISVIISALVPHFWMFLVSRVLIGASVGGTMICCYVYLMELCGKSFRLYLMGLHEISYIGGYFVLPIIAYAVPQWRHLQLVCSVPWLAVVAYYWLIPESPRWLVTVGRKAEAVDVLKYIATKNNLPTDKIEEIVNQMEKESLLEAAHHRATYLDLLRTPKLRVYTLIIAVVWLCVAHLFFGVNQYIGYLDGNIYLNVMFSALSLIPGIILCVVGAFFFKRKIGVITSFCLTGVSLLLFILMPATAGSLTLALAMIGQIGAFTAFVQIYLFSTEVFPTVIRNSAMGFASTFARFGGFIAPFVVNIGVEWISLLIFSSLAFLAALLCCFLPETKDVVLLNSIQQLERKGAKVNITATPNDDKL